MNNTTQLTEELKAQLIKLVNVYSITKTSYVYAEYFHNPLTTEERKIMQDPVYASHFNFINHVLFRNLVVEMSKLFSNRSSDKFRLSKFINGLKKEGQYYQLRFEQTLLLAWETALAANKTTIDLIIKIRDELYSHTDGKEEDYNELDINFTDLKKLMDLGENIIGHFFSFFFSADFDFTVPIFERERFPILKVLAIGEEKRKKDIMDEAIRGMNSYKQKK